jgi:hypothetical protein
MEKEQMMMTMIKTNKIIVTLLLSLILCNRIIAQKVDSTNCIILIKDLQTNKSIDSAIISLEYIKGELNIGLVDSCTHIKLELGMEYAITIEKHGYSFLKEKFNIIKEPDRLDFIKTFYLAPIEESVSLLPVFLFKKNSCNFMDKSKIKEDLEWFIPWLKEYPQYALEIEGFTDINEKDQEVLSLKRAEVIQKLLVKGGIEKKRILINTNHKAYQPYIFINSQEGVKRGTIADEKTILTDDKNYLRQYNRRVSCSLKMR